MSESPSQPSAVSAIHIPEGAFVGRESEIAYLQAALTRSLHGAGQLVFVAGPVGMGKSRLVEELQHRAEMHRVMVYTGVCHEHAPAPYHPWKTILRQFLADRDACAFVEAREYVEPLLRLMPELAESPEGASPPDAANGDGQAGLVDEAVTGLLLACNQPLLLIFKDVQYADAESLALLAAVGEQAPRDKLLLLALYRDEEIAATHALHPLLQRATLFDAHRDMPPPTGAAPFAAIHLSALSIVQSAELVRSMLRAVGEVAELPAALMQRVMTETGGNPLYIESAVRSLVAERALGFDGARWRVDAARLEHLPIDTTIAPGRSLKQIEQIPEAHAVLMWAAVMGRWLDMRVLREVSGLSDAALARRIDAVVREHILDRHHQAEQVIYHFANDQLRRALYATLDEAERVARHRRIGEVLRALYPEHDVAEALAWHFERARDWERALRYARMAADKARQMYANASAIQHYNQALDLLRAHPALADVETEYALLAGREEAYSLVGNRQGQADDLDAMARIAEAMGDSRRQVAVVTRQVALANQMGNQAEAVRAAERALALARQVKDRKLEADSLTALGEASYRLGEQERPHHAHLDALRIYRDLEDRAGEANSLRLLGRVAYRMGRNADVGRYYEQALTLYRELRDRSGEADVLNARGVVATDRARARDYYEQSLAIVQAIGDRSGQGRAYNNLGLLYLSLGLYATARDYLERATRIEREMGGRAILAYYLESLGRVYLALGEHESAEAVLQEGRALAHEIGDRWVEAAYWIGLGQVALARERVASARRLLETACTMLRELGARGDLAAALAWLGAAHLASGDARAARSYTTEAVDLLRQAGNAGDYAAQDVWWSHYQVLRATGDAHPLDKEAWLSLQQARAALFSGIATLSDEGLRRNYLNKVDTNHAILMEWARQSAAQQDVVAVPPLAESESDGATAEARHIKERLQRVLNISRKMNELHDDSLFDYVMDQVIELSGAERGFIVLLDGAGEMAFRAVRGMDAATPAHIQTEVATEVFREVRETRLPVLAQEPLAGQDAVSDLERRSMLCVPLMARADLLGMLYVDNRWMTGRFSQADADLLALFANQAATAIENAQLYQETVAWAKTLEQRVTERTSELREANRELMQRAKQLEVSNRVGQQLTMLLDLDSLLEQVVQQIQMQFNYYFVGVWLTMEKEGGVVLRAGAGRSANVGRMAGFTMALDAQTPIAQAAITGEETLLEEACATSPGVVPDALPETCSELVLPLRVGDTLIGALNIQSDRASAFTDDARLLLQTLAAQISITIRNAQLYEQEQRRRFLAEALERAGRELGRSLDIHEVPGRILDQLATVVPYERCSIMLEHGDLLKTVAQRGFPESKQGQEVTVVIREGDVFERMIRERRPIVVEDVMEEPGWQFVEGLAVHRSWLGAPIISRDQVFGMISMTRKDVGEFSAEDALLASTFASQAAIALQNAQLYGELNMAYRNLEKLDQTKSNFIEVTAHELRTPLTVIKGYAQVLGALPDIRDNPQVKPALEGILSGMGRMHEIVNSILDVTKIDSQVLQLMPHPTRICDLLTRVQQNFRGDLAERNLTLQVSDAIAELPPVQADSDMLYKVFYHLVMNGIKYTPDGGLIVVDGWADKDAPVVEITVRDTGIGIDPEHHKLIFEKFYQTGLVALHSSGRTKFKGGGPGLGLAIARGIVAAHDGSIWVESAGHDEETCPGSTFHVRLPL